MKRRIEKQKSLRLCKLQRNLFLACLYDCTHAHIVVSGYFFSMCFIDHERSFSTDGRKTDGNVGHCSSRERWRSSLQEKRCEGFMSTEGEAEWTRSSLHRPPMNTSPVLSIGPGAKPGRLIYFWPPVRTHITAGVWSHACCVQSECGSIFSRLVRTDRIWSILTFVTVLSYSLFSSRWQIVNNYLFDP